MGTRRPRIRAFRAAAAACLLAGAVLAAGAFAAQPVPRPEPFWPATTPITLPAGAKTAFPPTPLYLFSGPMSIDALACTSAGNCVGVGDYEDTNGSNDYQAMYVSEAGGVWGAAHELALPKHVTPPGAEIAGLDAVACTSPGNCVAVGYYTAAAGSVTTYESMAVVESAGAWGQAQPIPPPVASAASALSGVSCVSDGNCVAVGGYTGAQGTPGEYEGRAMAVAMIGGAWGAATDVKLPANASTTSAQEANLTSVSCNTDAVRRSGLFYRAGSCVAVGNYLDDSTAPGNELTMAASEAGGVWSQATPISQPSGTSVPQDQTLQQVGHQSVSCFSVGNCVAVSVFADATSLIAGMIATETAGSWGPGRPLGPATAVDGGPPFVVPESVSCSSAGNCVVVGVFTDRNDDDERAMVASEVDGEWGAAIGLTPPPQPGPGGGSPAPPTGGPGPYDPGAFLYAVACTSATSCVAGGGDTDGEGNYGAIVVSSVLPPTIATATLPPGVVGSPYSAQLKATGGGGEVAWSLQPGSLPAGLKLNSSSGLISGTPTATGTSHFTVALSEPDLSPPAPPATAALSIAVSAKQSSGSGSGGGSGGGGGTHGPTATIAAVTAKGAKIKVTVACAGAASERCSGTLALSALEHLDGHRITAISAARLRTRTVALGHTTYVVAAGASAAVTIKLNATAKQLLSRHHRFRAALALTAAGSARAALTRTVTFAR